MEHHDSRRHYLRADHKTRDVVDQAIAALPAVGLRQAAEFLSAMHVPHEVALRALLHPQRRRSLGASL